MLGAIWDISELTNRMCFLKAAILKLGFEKILLLSPRHVQLFFGGRVWKNIYLFSLFIYT